jgi:hypothetical protein
MLSFSFQKGRMMEIFCPRCLRKYTVLEDWIGKEVQCKNMSCQHVFSISSGSSQASADAIVSPTGQSATASDEYRISSPEKMPPAPPKPSQSPPPVPTADTVLANYNKSVPREGPSFTAKVKEWLGIAGKRAKAIKLQHDVKTLQNAVEAQLESLGKIALTHRPDGLEYQRELSELARTQSERDGKLAELNALTKTPGSGAASRQVKQELSDLAVQERRLMIAIGNSVATTRPEMPDGAGQYSALDRLKATLAARLQELHLLLGQVAESGSLGLSEVSWKKPAMLGGGIVAALIIAYLFLSVVSRLFSGGGVPAWASYYIPEESFAVVYVNVDDLRKNELFSEMEKFIRGKVLRQEFGFEFDMNDISELLIAGDDNPLFVIRMKTDCSLKSFLPKEQRNQPFKSIKEVEYVELGRGKVLAKTEARAFCLAPKEDVLKNAVGRLERKERAKLDKKLQAGLDAVAGNVFIAGVRMNKGHDMPFDFEEFHASAWVKSSSIQVEATSVFANAKDAENVKKMAEGALAKSNSDMPPEMKKELEPLISAVKIRQSGNYVYWNAKWNNADLVAVTNKFKKEFSHFPF